MLVLMLQGKKQCFSQFLCTDRQQTGFQNTQICFRPWGLCPPAPRPFRLNTPQALFSVPMPGIATHAQRCQPLHTGCNLSCPSRLYYARDEIVTPENVNKIVKWSFSCICKHVSGRRGVGDGEKESASATSLFLWLCHSQSVFCNLKKQANHCAWFIFCA